jgi:tetratricopeptide (TPR) repeat protein
VEGARVTEPGGPPAGEADAAARPRESRAADAIATARRTTVDRLRRRLAGDLDEIVLRALARDPSDRYASVEQFADDLRRHRDRLPVRARRRSVTYTVVRFVQRHRTGTVAAALVVMSLAGGLGVALREARRAATQARIAEGQRDHATQLAGVLTDMFRVPDPDRAMGRDISAREVLDRGAERIERDFSGETATRAALLSDIAQVYANLGEGSRAAELLRQAVALQTGPGAQDASALATSLDRLGWLESSLGLPDSALAHLERAIELRRGNGAAGPELAASLYHAGHVLSEQGRHAEARTHLVQSVEIWRGDAPNDDAVPAEVLLALANAEHAAGDFDQAVQRFEQTVERFGGRRDPPDRSLATALFNLGMINQFRGRFVDAEPFIRDALEVRLRLFSPDHPDVLQSQMSLAVLLNELRRPVDAEPLFREVAERSARTLAPDHPNVLIAWQGLAATLNQLGEQDTALVLFDRVIAGHRSQLGEDHALVVYNMILSGEPLLALGRFSDALLRFEDAAARITRRSGTDHPYLALAGIGRARALHGLDRDTEARAAFDHALDSASRILGADHRIVLDGRHHFAVFLAESGHADAADSVFAHVLSSRRTIDAERPGNLVPTLMAWGRFLDRNGRAAEAATLLREALEIRSRLVPPGHPLIIEIQNALERAGESQMDSTARSTASRNRLHSTTHHVQLDG